MGVCLLCQKVFTDGRFFLLLLRLDQDIAAAARRAGCACGGVLHSATYRRKPRGVPAGLDDDGYAKRFSFCCAVDGCRLRVTPPSVRFLGRKVYLGAVVVLASALRHGLTRTRVARLHQLLGVSARTLGRWRTWWRTTFADSSWWRTMRARFAPPVAASALPGSLLERFPGVGWAPLVATLRFLSPMTTSSEVCG